MPPGVGAPSRGYFGVVVYRPKYEVNLGTLWRSVNTMGGDFFGTVQPRGSALAGTTHQRVHEDPALGQPSDTTHAEKHVPYLMFDSVEALIRGVPMVDIIGVELNHRASDLPRFVHPQRAVYLLGAEDEGIPDSVLARCNSVVQIPSFASLNVAVAGSIVVYDRVAKAQRAAAGRWKSLAPEGA